MKNKDDNVLSIVKTNSGKGKVSPELHDLWCEVESRTGQLIDEYCLMQEDIEDIKFQQAVYSTMLDVVMTLVHEIRGENHDLEARLFYLETHSREA